MGDQDEAPPATPDAPPPEAADTGDDEPDESLKERLWGLTEMFPEPTVNKIVDGAENGTIILAKLYKFFRMSTWIIVTSALILLAPIYFECTRLAYERSQQEQFGPCVGGKHSKFMRKPGSHPCQPFRPQPQQPKES